MIDRLKIPLEKLGSVKVSDYTKKVIVDSQPDHLPVLQKFIST
jgi:hypothetical protein